MDKKIHSVIMLALLLIGMLTLTFNIQPVKALGTIYIRPDGSIDPPTAPILRDGDLYTLTGDITSDADGIVIERNNMTLDGAGYTLQGTAIQPFRGIELEGRSNVTIRKMKIEGFRRGINLELSSNNTIFRNNIETSSYGISLYGSSSTNNIISANSVAGNNNYGILLACPSNSVCGNSITNNLKGIGIWHASSNSIVGNDVRASNQIGIYLHFLSSNNTISGNIVTDNSDGIQLHRSSSNSISGNNITENNYGIWILDTSNNNSMTANSITANNRRGIGLSYSSNNIISGNNIEANGIYGIWLQKASNNSIYHNNLITNAEQVNDWSWTHPETEPSVNTWDDGYPSGGNYWSDYEERYPDAEELDGSGIWDTPYVIDENNQDNYPPMEPCTPTPPIPTTINELKTEIEELYSTDEIDNQGIVVSLIAKLNVAQKLVDKGKIDEAGSILEEDFIPQVQNLSGIHITPETAELLIESAEYIISHL